VLDLVQPGFARGRTRRLGRQAMAGRSQQVGYAWTGPNSRRQRPGQAPQNGAFHAMNLRQRGREPGNFPGSRSALSRFFARHGITIKKKSAGGGAQASRRRPRTPTLHSRAGFLDPAHLVFIDETAVTTNMLRLSGALAFAVDTCRTVPPPEHTLFRVTRSTRSIRRSPRFGEPYKWPLVRFSRCVRRHGRARQVDTGPGHRGADAVLPSHLPRDVVPWGFEDYAPPPPGPPS